MFRLLKDCPQQHSLPGVLPYDQKESVTLVDAKWTQSVQTPNPVALMEFPGRIGPLLVVFNAADRGMTQEVMICRVKMFCCWWSFKPRRLQSSRWPFIRLFNGPLVSPTYCLLQLLQEIRYTTLSVVQSVFCLSLTVAPEDDFTVPAEVIILQHWHLFLPQGRHSPFWLSSSDFSLSRACTRKSRRLFGRLKAMTGLLW